MPIHRRPENRKGCRKQVVGMIVIVTFAAIAGAAGVARTISETGTNYPDSR